MASLKFLSILDVENYIESTMSKAQHLMLGNMPPRRLRTGHRFVTNFPKEKLPYYKEAVDESKNEGEFVIYDQAYDFAGRPMIAYLTLYYNGYDDLDNFWRNLCFVLNTKKE